MRRWSRCQAQGASLLPPRRGPAVLRPAWVPSCGGRVTYPAGLLLIGYETGMVQEVREARQVNADDFESIRELGQQLRVDSIRSSTSAASGHPTSSMSAADLMAVLLARHLRYDWDHPDQPTNDHLIFSKGHASPLVYAMFKAAGAITDAELLTFRRLGSRLQGHPTPVLPWVDVATGSLGQGLPVGVGLSLAASRLDQSPSRTWVLCGDSELAEGSIWEAFDHASFERLGNLTALLDVNRLGQTGETMHGWDLETYGALGQ